MSHVTYTPIREMLTRRDVFRGLHAGLAGLALGSVMQGAAATIKRCCIPSA